MDGITISKRWGRPEDISNDPATKRLQVALNKVQRGCKARLIDAEELINMLRTCDEYVGYYYDYAIPDGTRVDIDANAGSRDRGGLVWSTQARAIRRGDDWEVVSIYRAPVGEVSVVLHDGDETVALCRPLSRGRWYRR